LNSRASSPSVVDDETKTQLEEATFFLPLADIPGDDLPWIPAADGAAAVDQGQAGGIDPDQEKEEGAHRLARRVPGLAGQWAPAEIANRRLKISLPTSSLRRRTAVPNNYLDIAKKR
jgi:hypothetical protein